MTLERSRKVLEIFERAIELPDDQIAQFLDNECDDAELRAEVESLVAVSMEEGEFLPTVDELVGTKPSANADNRKRSKKETDIRPGSTVMGRYAVQESIGTGGMGIVYRATDARLGRDVAIKVLSRANISDPKMRERFDREMRAVASIAHPNVMAIYDIGDHDGIQIAVMELVEGCVLRKLLSEKLSVGLSVEIACGVAAALSAAHQRDLMHRDIKPENIMVSQDHHVKVLDFGLARPKYTAGDNNLTGTAVVIGTFPYMSPEQAEGRELENSTDVFSMGTVLFEMLSGENPFRGESVFETMRQLARPSPPKLSEFDVANVPGELDCLLTEMLQHDPAKRPAAKEIFHRLQVIRHDLAIACGLTINSEADTTVGASEEPTDATQFAKAETKVQTVVPPTLYARCDDIHIAYQVFGDGPIELVIVPGFISNVDNCWASTHHAQWLLEIGSFARVAIFDKRGTGLSDRVSNLPSMEERMEDVRTVMDAVGFESAALMGLSEGGSLASLFAASYPERCRGLILHGGFACFDSWLRPEQLEEFFDYVRSGWGTGMSLPRFAPTMTENAEFQRWWGKFERLGANPGSAIDLMRMNSQINISGVLPTIQAPTLVVHRTEDVLIDPDASRHLAENIPSAKLFSSPGTDHLPWVSDAVEGEVAAIRDFLQSLPDVETAERVLATVVAVRFTSRPLPGNTYDEVATEASINRVKEQIETHRGSPAYVRQDVCLTTFDGPTRAIRCAKSIASTTAKVSIGLHAGEIIMRNDSVEGDAVDVATNIARLSDEADVIVSQSVKGLVAGTGVQFTDIGLHQLTLDAEKCQLFRTH